MKSARGPLPKKIIFGGSTEAVGVFSGILGFFREEVRVVRDLGVVILDGVEVSFVIHAIESIFLAADVVDEEDAVEVVNFVKKGAGEKTFGLQTDFVAVFEKGFNFDLAGTTNLAVNFWDGETAFEIGFDFAFGADDFGVDEGGKMVIGFVVEVVADNDDALVDAELRGGHGGRKFVGVLFFPFEGFCDHVANDFLGFGGDFANFGGFSAETRVRSGDNIFHWYILYYSSDGGSRTMENCDCSVKGKRASTRDFREGDLRMSCQVKPRVPRS